MTAEEAVKRLKALTPDKAGYGDSEVVHVEADQILVDFLKSHHPEIAEAYENLQEVVFFWYA